MFRSLMSFVTAPRVRNREPLNERLPGKASVAPSGADDSKGSASGVKKSFFRRRTALSAQDVLAMVGPSGA